jgi:hypothetical protein
MDIIYVVITVIFFAFAWAFTTMCDRLDVAGQANASSKD